MRRGLSFSAALSSLVLFACGCPQVGFGGGGDAGPPNYGLIDVKGNDRAYLNNLVGRWFTYKEVSRLDDDTLTPEDWCRREPAYLMIRLDSVMVRCENQETYSAGISRVVGQNGDVTIILRAKEESPFRQLVLRRIVGTTARIEGSPCVAGEVEYTRFPKLEILSRQILNGSSCAQVQSVVPPPVEEE